MTEQHKGPWAELYRGVDPRIWEIHPALLNALLVPLRLLSRYLMFMEERLGSKVNYEAIYRPFTENERLKLSEAVDRVLDYDEQVTPQPDPDAENRMVPLRSHDPDWGVLDLIAGERGKLVPQTQLAMFFGEDEEPRRAVVAAVDRLNKLLKPWDVAIVSELTFVLVPQTFLKPEQADPTTQDQP